MQLADLGKQQKAWYYAKWTGIGIQNAICQMANIEAVSAVEGKNSDEEKDEQFNKFRDWNGILPGEDGFCQLDFNNPLDNTDYYSDDQIRWKTGGSEGIHPGESIKDAVKSEHPEITTGEQLNVKNLVQTVVQNVLDLQSKVDSLLKTSQTNNDKVVDQIKDFNKDFHDSLKHR